jgi:hypothetical protein
MIWWSDGIFGERMPDFRGRRDGACAEPASRRAETAFFADWTKRRCALPTGAERISAFFRARRAPRCLPLGHRFC